jgi:transposase InsO family protein
MCRVLDVSRSGFYGWLDRDEPDTPFNRRLSRRIRTIFEEEGGTRGRPYIYWRLRREGWEVNHKRVERLMRAEGLKAEPKQGYKITTDSNHNRPVAPNRLERDFTAEAPNQVWVSDITYIRTHEGWLYLAAIMDLFSRKVVGWQLAPRLRAELVDGALQKAVRQREVGNGLIFHSDQGVQYTSDRVQSRLDELDIKQSMARRGDCWDNAPSEAWFATLKRECVPGRGFETMRRAKRKIFKYIEGKYNRGRLHSSLNYRTPEEYEERFT